MLSGVDRVQRRGRANVTGDAVKAAEAAVSTAEASNMAAVSGGFDDLNPFTSL